MPSLIFVKGGEGSGHHGHKGVPGKRGGSAPGDQAPEAPTVDQQRANKVWTGEQQPKAEKRLTKLQTGSLGEEMAIHFLEKKLGVDFRTLNDGLNNSPIDVAGNHHAVEVKTGLASNGKTAQHWRATIGQPGKKETELISQMTPKEKREHNTWKREQILKRKYSALAEMEKTIGGTIKPATIGIILAPDGSRGDVYYIPGFHQRLTWKSYATDQYYVGTYDVNS